MNTQRLRLLTTRVLVGFALLSIGFSLGKLSVSKENAFDVSPLSSGSKLVVYYMHASFRCDTCNTIEKMAHDFLREKYADALNNGTIEWVSVDYMEETKLAKQFDVVAGCVVVARIENGMVREFKRLDEVWTLMSDTEAFNQYLDAAIDELGEKQ